MDILTSMGQLTCVISGVCWSTSYSFVSPLRFLRWQIGAMMIGFLMLQWWWWDYFTVAIQFGCWSEFYRWSDFLPPGRCPGGQFSLERIFCLPGKLSCGTFPVGLSWDFCAPGKHLTHYWDVICPKRCLGIIWYLCTYDDTYLIRLYVKVCVRYGMFLYIRLQYVPGVCPNMSRGTLSPFGTATLENPMYSLPPVKHKYKF